MCNTGRSSNIDSTVGNMGKPYKPLMNSDTPQQTMKKALTVKQSEEEANSSIFDDTLQLETPSTNIMS
jgi:hypothetical protein